MRIRIITSAVLAVSLAMPAIADEAVLRARLADTLPGIEVDAIEESRIPGVYTVIIGPRVLYMSADGRFLIQGEMLDLEDERNLTDARRSAARVEWLDTISESSMVIFEPRAETHHTITVFTDIDCTYCRTMHAEIEALQRSGVRVRYLLYPRSGQGTESARKADAVWCSRDRNDALTRAKAGERVRARACGETPVATNRQLGSALGVTGTPTIVTSDGDIISGYLPHAKLLSELRRLQARHGD